MLSAESNKLVAWLTREVNERGWSFRELGRRAGLSSGAISKVVTGASLPGWDFCQRIARALQVPPEKVFRMAGLLPPVTEDQAENEELLAYFHALDREDRHRLIIIARALHGARAEYETGTVRNKRD